MENYLDQLKKAYDRGILQEHQRLQTCEGKVELDKIISKFSKYSHDAKTILDIGCGTGTYSNLLSKKGYKIGCIDISEKSIDFLMSHHLNPNIMFGKVGSASDLEKLTLPKTDAILLLGPMYHIIEKNNRIKALQNCWSLLNNGGIIYIMFLNRLKNWSESELAKHGISQLTKTKNGWISWVNYQGEDIPQFRCTTEQAKEETLPYFNTLDIIPIPNEMEVEQFCIIAQKKKNSYKLGTKIHFSL